MDTATYKNETVQHQPDEGKAVETITFEGQVWFKITDHHKMRPFFMNVVSDSNHWMFISSNGGLTAGRKNSEYALFPYYTDDKITESADITGSKSIFQIKQSGKLSIWEPFSERYTNKYELSRNVYKNFYGNKLMFEEINHDLGLTFRYQWNSSNLHGFVRKAEFINHSGQDCGITMLDGLQNILPFGVEPDVQNASSNLVDAYKRSELLPESGLGIYALSAIIVDKAEPSEALKANVAWSSGFESAEYLVSSLQLDAFRQGREIVAEDDVKGEKGAYFIHTEFSLQHEASRSWTIVANVNQDQAQVVQLSEAILHDDTLIKTIEEDIERGSDKLDRLVAGADGIRLSGDTFKDARHYSNVLFNIMRGGTFDHNYRVEKRDFVSYVKHASKAAFTRNEALLNSLPEAFSNTELYARLDQTADPDFYRLAKEYLPLKFSRRHGDPSRPWNKFSINTQSEIDGSKILDYEGNWRDIFQNWEALVHAYPGFIEGMIFKFLNTSTFDGYNPYRVTKGGFDWETIEPDNPWSYIGYWGDHQIIYMLKFLEFYQNYRPEGFDELFANDSFVYANVPYRIKPYESIAQDPKNTIDFDDDGDRHIREMVAKKGADGSLLPSADQEVYHVNFLEKILAATLAKVSNFIPEAGIWLNTQRPEWNDANNALVGNGVSMVTLYYLRRFLSFFEDVLAETNVSEVRISAEMMDVFTRIKNVLETEAELLNGPIDDAARKRITDALGQAGSDYRTGIYENGFSGEKHALDLQSLLAFARTARRWMEHSIEANQREDKLYHAYNLMSMDENGVSVQHLYEMLEGQVAVLSSGYLSPEASVEVFDALRTSALYRKDQNSYMLYPNKQLPRFLEKNIIPAYLVERSPLMQKLLEDGNHSLVTKDVRGQHHFNGNFRNAEDVKAALDGLAAGRYETLVAQDRKHVLHIFERVFNHKAFTGRSGTFFAYEGLGSIYWHMVSKLHLAAGEVCNQAFREGASEEVKQKLIAHFYEVEEGIGIHKTPDVYGAFPTDAYSHTPWHRGAQQPGMTGQVKEDILSAIIELGVELKAGRLHFDPKFLREQEFSGQEGDLRFADVDQQGTHQITVPEGALCFSVCQVPVLYQKGGQGSIEVQLTNGEVRRFEGGALDKATSDDIFNRSGKVAQISVSLSDHHL